jgi:hypothetical protein
MKNKRTNSTLGQIDAEDMLRKEEEVGRRLIGRRRITLRLQREVA